MTLIGPDRTGLVEAVARAVAGHGGNWLESRMCRLGGEFAGILRVEVDVEKKPALLDAVQKIPGLRVIVGGSEINVAAKKEMAAFAFIRQSLIRGGRITIVPRD